eukprot:TRINITY_DN2379_c0_g1_i14.p1 TRINITY_DN2379_c0_g1~~TRINITY_DN2379_c0_g1_i14.p1  ORF type:complete len:400 (-),score=70.41 TRINITY_DN2379_c0_g1_i14:6-1157(-)
MCIRDSSLMIYAPFPLAVGKITLQSTDESFTVQGSLTVQGSGKKSFVSLTQTTKAGEEILQVKKSQELEGWVSNDKVYLMNPYRESSYEEENEIKEIQDNKIVLTQKVQKDYIRLDPRSPYHLEIETAYAVNLNRAVTLSSPKSFEVNAVGYFNISNAKIIGSINLQNNQVKAAELSYSLMSDCENDCVTVKGGNTVVSNNFVYGSKQNGITVHQNENVSIKHNIITNVCQSNNEGCSGIQAGLRKASRVEQNIVLKSGQFGFSLNKVATKDFVNISDNIVTGAKVCLKIENSANNESPTLDKNWQQINGAHLYDCQEHAVHIDLVNQAQLAFDNLKVLNTCSVLKTTLNTQNNNLSLIHISEPTRLLSISYAVFCLKKKKNV